MVIIHDENHLRSFWKLGRVNDLIKGDDSQICGAVIDVVTNGKPQTLRRPITHLYPLKVMSKAKKSSIIYDQDDSTQNVTVDNPVSRPVWAAAQRARQQVSEWITDQDDTDHICNMIVCYIVFRLTFRNPSKLTWSQLGGSVM